MRVLWNNHELPLQIGEEIYVQDGKEFLPHRVLSSSEQQKNHLVTLSNITNRTEAEAFRGKLLFLPEEMLPKLPQGEYYSYQILGLLVRTEEGKVLGKIVKVFSTGANDIYEVQVQDVADKSTVLIPAIHDVIVAIDLEKGEMVIRTLEGLL